MPLSANRPVSISPKRHYLGRMKARVADDPAVVSASAVSLSTSALFAALMMHLEQKGILSVQEQRAVYERAVDLLNTHPVDDGGITDLARAVIESGFARNNGRI